MSDHVSLRQNHQVFFGKLAREVGKMRENIDSVPEIHRWRVEASIAANERLLAEAERQLERFDKGARATELEAHQAHRQAKLQLEAARSAIEAAVESGALDSTDDELEALTRAERVAVLRFNAAIRGVQIATAARSNTLDPNRLRRAAQELERGREIAVSVAEHYARTMGAPPTVTIGPEKLGAYHAAHGEALESLVALIAKTITFHPTGSTVAEQIVAPTKPADERLHRAWGSYRDAAARLRWVGASAEAEDAGRRGSEAMAQLVQRVNEAARAPVAQDVAPSPTLEAVHS